jgi:hypothetical protein
MSLNMFLGSRGEQLSKEGQKDKRIKIQSPVLNAKELNDISKMEGVTLATLSTLYPVTAAVSGPCSR